MISVTEVQRKLKDFYGISPRAFQWHCNKGNIPKPTFIGKYGWYYAKDIKKIMSALRVKWTIVSIKERK
jgi:hypothetical protein